MMSPLTFTVLGASGFIGRHLIQELQQRGHDVYSPAKGESDIFGRNLGHVIYAIGLTADFRTRPYETVEAHVCFLRKVLERGQFDSLLYLSSTRIYRRCKKGDESQGLVVDPSDQDQVYDLSKLMGESLCWATGRPSVRIARLSNVYGKDYSSTNFLAEILRQAICDGRVTLRTSSASSKDYVAIADVTALLLSIAVSGREKVYNVASGKNITHKELLTVLSRLIPLIVEEVEPDSPAEVFPTISIDRIQREFSFVPQNLLVDLPGLVGDFKKVVPT